MLSIKVSHHHHHVVGGMVEGHSVHRVAAVHTKRLVQKIVHATSPNGRFAEGAAEIDGSVFDKISAVG